MRRPIQALTAASLAVALSATMLRAQPAPNVAPSGEPPVSYGMGAARGPRQLLRTGRDYLGYQEYERALTFFREAETRRGELSEAERQALKQGIEQARRGLREASNAGGPRYALGRNRRAPGAIALAKTAPDPVRQAKTAPDPVRRVGAEAPGDLADLPPLPDEAAPALPASRPVDLPPLPDEAAPALPAPEPTPLPSPEPTPLPSPEPAPLDPAAATVQAPEVGLPALPPLDAEPAPIPVPAPDAEPAPLPAPANPASDLLPPLPAPDAAPAPSPAPAGPMPASEPAAPPASDLLPPLPVPEAAPTPAPEPPPADPAPTAPDDTAPTPTVEPERTVTPRDSERSLLSPEVRRRVEEVARAQDEAALRRDTSPTAGAPSIDGGGNDDANRPSTRLELSRAPSPSEARPIRAIPVPDDFVPIRDRDWGANRKYFASAAACHGPLYFQDAALERYGHSVEQFVGPKGRYLTYPLDDPSQSKQRNQIVQPFFSAGLFAAQIALWPYHLIVDPPWEPEYDLGYYRPGDRIPPDVYYLPLKGVGPPLHSRDY